MEAVAFAAFFRIHVDSFQVDGLRSLANDVGFENQPVIFEINPRFSGGIPLTIAAGADFPKLLVKLAMGSTVEPAIGRFKDNLWMTNYEASVFLDASQLRMSSLSERGVRIGEVA